MFNLLCLKIKIGSAYPRVGLEHCFLKDIGRVEYGSTNDLEAWDDTDFVLFTYLFILTGSCYF